MRRLPAEISLQWSEGRIEQLERSVAALEEENFVHWTTKAQLFAARGDTGSARTCIDHVLSHWLPHHANNNHFLCETVIATLLIGHFDLVYKIFQNLSRMDWQFEIEIVDGLSAVPFVIEWEVMTRINSIFRFDTSLYRSDSAHHVFLNWIWCFQLFDSYHRSPLAVSGKTLLTVGDVAVGAGLAFSGYSPDVFLVPDCFFLSKLGYRDAIAQLDRNWVDWADRRPVVFWRGTTTGAWRGGWRSLQRVRLCQAAMDSPDSELFDVGLSSVVQIENAEWVAEIAASGLMRPFVPSELFGSYKYLVDIDGNSSSWEGLFVKLYTGSTVLKVASPSGYRQWYYDELKPWINYVPVSEDLADFAENVAWLRGHEAQAELIGKRGRALARSLTYEAELSRAVPTIVNSIRFFQDSHRLPMIHASA